MPYATRLNDDCTGHDACGARPLVTSSENVFINSKGAGRQSDLYASHGCVVHSTHQDEISGGSSTVFINGLPAARIGDSVSIGGNVAQGSPDVFIGG